MLDTSNGKKPLIGITSGATSSKFAMLCHKYAVVKAGGRPFRLSPGVNMDLVREISGLIITGGGDINPKLYGQENTASINIDDERDMLEKECISLAFAEQIPILGICRGSQLINVVRGGDLHQDIPTIMEGFVPTQSLWAKAVVRRKIQIEADSRLSRVLGDPEELWINSLHHQAHNEIGRGLRVVAKDEQGIVQSIEGVSPEHFVLGLQWHPELMLYSSAQRRIYQALIAASLRTRGNWQDQTDMLHA